MTVLPPLLHQLVSGAELDDDGLRVAGLHEPIAGAERSRMEHQLGDALYQKWHAGTRRELGERVASRDLADDGLLAELVTVYAQRRTPSDGWSVLRVDPESVVAERDGLRVAFDTVDGVVASETAVGDELRVQIPAVRPLLSPGFTIFDGRVGSPDTRDGWTMRLYGHLPAERALDAARTLIEGLDERACPFRVKLLSAARSYPRYDALVAYLPADAGEDLVAAAGWLSTLTEEGTSPFARRVAPGVGFAWEPAEQQWPPRSFGQHRCALVAAALLDWAQNGAGLLDAAELVADHLARGGVDPEQPWREFASPADPMELVPA